MRLGYAQIVLLVSLLCFGQETAWGHCVSESCDPELSAEGTAADNETPVADDPAKKIAETPAKPAIDKAPVVQGTLGDSSKLKNLRTNLDANKAEQLEIYLKDAKKTQDKLGAEVNRRLAKFYAGDTKNLSILSADQLALRHAKIEADLHQPGLNDQDTNEYNAALAEYSKERMEKDPKFKAAVDAQNQPRAGTGSPKGPGGGNGNGGGSNGGGGSGNGGGGSNGGNTNNNANNKTNSDSNNNNTGGGTMSGSSGGSGSGSSSSSAAAPAITPISAKPLTLPSPVALAVAGFDPKENDSASTTDFWKAAMKPKPAPATATTTPSAADKLFSSLVTPPTPLAASATVSSAPVATSAKVASPRANGRVIHERFYPTSTTSRIQ